MFEDSCRALLREKYGVADFVWIPATIGGDRGIEGFATDGSAYQCYADRDSIDLRQRTDKQKRKLTNDTTKLNTNAAELTVLFSGNQVTLRRYYLMVPQYHAAELLGTAA
jgi:hypothetical protein